MKRLFKLFFFKLKKTKLRKIQKTIKPFKLRFLTVETEPNHLKKPEPEPNPIELFKLRSGSVQTKPLPTVTDSYCL